MFKNEIDKAVQKELNNYLNDDIIIYILTFLYGSCGLCSKKFYEYYLIKNCEIYKYYNIFDDRYFFPREMEKYRYLCLCL